MTALFLVQLFLPLFFIAWIALAPPRSAFGFFCQTVGLAIALFALAVTGLWLFPPWWTPYVFGSLLIAAAAAGLKRRYPFKSWLPSGWQAWAFTAVSIFIGGWGADQSVRALAGRAQQAGTGWTPMSPSTGWRCCMRTLKNTEQCLIRSRPVQICRGN